MAKPSSNAATRKNRTNPSWKYCHPLVEGDTNTVVCNYCGKITKGGTTRTCHHRVAVTVHCRRCCEWGNSRFRGETTRVVLVCVVLLISFRIPNPGFKVGSGQPKMSQFVIFGKFSKKKNVSSAILPPLLNLWRPPWCRHLKPATPPLFGGIFSKIRHAMAPP